MDGQSFAALATLITYMVVLVGIGLYMARRTRTEDSFLLGERSLGPFVAGLAYAASTSSAWVLLGYSGFVYAAGLSAIWMVPGILAGYAAVWFFAGPVLRRASHEKGHLTLTDFLTEDAGPRAALIIRIAASLMIAFLFSYYVASQFQGAGTAFDGLFGTGLATGVIIGAAIILAYTFLGGFLAVAVSDTIQGLIMAGIAVVLPLAAFLHVGGWAGIGAALEAAPDTYLTAFGGRSGSVAAGLVVGLFASGFAALGQPHLLAFVMAAKDRRAQLAGAGVALGWGVIVYTGMTVLGLAGRALFGGDMMAEGVFFAAAAELFPAAFAGFVAAATLSAIMSTVDSQLVVVGGAVGHDLGLARLFGRREVLAARLAILTVSIIGIVITLTAPATIFDRTLFAWTALGATFGPTVVCRALGPRPGGAAVLASVLLGFGTAILFEFVLPAGPGNVNQRVLPWIAAAVPLILLPRGEAQKPVGVPG
jgi:sodium/proline symporter